ncbi:MAG: hypothetical protein HKN08_11515 [Gammaproteobacteria bacterium]|nr:hypothetical protein [Gammaproteobacteria bacterium]
MKTKAYIKQHLKEDLIIIAVFGAMVFLPPELMAQDEDQELRPKHERLLNHFDKDGDGQLNDREAYHARKFHQRWKENHDSGNRPDIRPDRVRPDLHQDRRVRPDVRPDVDRVRDVRRRIDRNNDRRISPRERVNARRIQARRSR